MKKSELKTILKPLIKECIKEVIFEDGVLSSLISEVVRGTNGVQAVNEAKVAQGDQQLLEEQQQKRQEETCKTSQGYWQNNRNVPKNKQSPTGYTLR